ncbi:helix-turn-helix domain-containing protein [Pseudomonas sp. UL073]|uniref:Helix-turn-helix domain-containing protein n=1 Tax=Zestomonas insulae TaxID=2809017 RepID=A0ABS2IA19_9GAMM|nr:RodZ family helix-turn-helix domain-containing protein [Pseudomonas insulae]MBM7059966.1 helix-turn-helix domain-containing protein [Pseudomonas insulae]
MKAAHPESVATIRSNPGETLRKAREAKGWNPAEVAAQLNLTSQRLGQLEAGDFDKLPGHTFARGYLRTYAKLLGLDADAVVQEFDQYTGTDATGSAVHGLAHIEQPVRLSQSVLRLVSFALLVGLAGVGFLWWQDQGGERLSESVGVNMEHVEVESADGTTQIHPLDEPEDQAVIEAQEESQAPLAEVSPEVAAQPEGEGAVASAPASGSVLAPESAAPAAPVASAPAPAAVPAPTAPAANAVAPVVPPAAAVAAAPAAAPSVNAPVVAAAGEGVVRLEFSADCWIQITDATGKVLVSGLKRSGNSIELAGKAPLELRLGFARGAQVSYNGQPVDVKPFVSGETARLKLGQ